MLGQRQGNEQWTLGCSKTSYVKKLSLSQWQCEVAVREPTCTGNSVTEARGAPLQQCYWGGGGRHSNSVTEAEGAPLQQCYWGGGGPLQQCYWGGGGHSSSSSPPPSPALLGEEREFLKNPVHKHGLELLDLQPQSWALWPISHSTSHYCLRIFQLWSFAEYWTTI